MVAVLDFMVFAAAFAVSVWVFAFTLVPALPRIVALLRTGVDIAAPVDGFAVFSDRRLRQRVRAERPARLPGFREAA